jgi:hypothetical protein
MQQETGKRDEVQASQHRGQPFVMARQATEARHLGAVKGLAL